MTIENLEWRDVKDLIPYARNSRTHSEDQITQIASSIKEFGWTNPILLDGDKGIIAGHGRLMAARKLGMDKVPVIQLSGMTPTQKKAYIIADNQFTLNYALADTMIIPKAGEVNGEMEWNIEAPLDNESINAIVKAKSALAESETVVIKPFENEDGEFQIEMQIGRAHV